MSNYTISVPASSIQKAISYGANVSVTGSGVSFPDGTTVTSVASSVIVPDLAYAQANVATGIATDAYTQANAGIVFTQGVYDFANTIGGGSAIDNVARQIAISARSNTIYTQGVDATQNTWISSNVISLQSQISANVNSLNGINNTQNTRLQSVETINTNQNTSINIIQGVDNTQNVQIAGIQGVDLAQNTSISTLNSQIITNQGINDNQNTRIQSIETINNNQNNTIIQVNQFAAGAFDFANVSSGIQSGINATQNTWISSNVVSLQSQITANVNSLNGINNSQNTTITQVNQFTQSAYNQANTGTVLAQSAFNYANTISGSGTSIDSFARTTANTGLALAQAGFNKANTAITTSGGSISGSLTVTANNLNVYSGNSTSDMFQANFSAGNFSRLRMYGYRWADGSSWTTASTRIQQRIDATDQGYIEFNPPSGNYGMAFGSGVTESVRILQSGNVGIKTINPTTALEVNGNIKANSAFLNGSVGINTTNPTTALEVNGTIKANNAFLNGSVGINTTNPQYALEVNGTIKANNAILNDINIVPYIQSAFNTANSASFPAGTALLFQQTAAPTGWTKVTTHNDKALRVVSGTVGTGGSVAFSAAFASKSVTGTTDGTTLSESQIPSHVHVFGGDDQVATQGSFTTVSNFDYDATSTTGGGGVRMNTYATGGGGSHNHTFTGTAINLAVNYVDVIIATKN